MSYFRVPGTNLKALPLEAFPPEAWQVASGPKVGDDLTEYVAHVAALYRCIDIRAESILKIPWKIYRGDSVVYRSGEGELSPDLAWIEKLPDFIGLTEASLCLTNQAYWFVDRNRARVNDLRWFAVDTMTPVWDANDGLVGYERRIGNQVIKFSADDDVIVYTWRQNPMHETEPKTSAAQAAANSAGVLFNLDTFTSGYFERGAIKATLLTVTGDRVLERAEAEKILSWWKRVFVGVKNAWSTDIVHSSLEPVQIGEGLAEIGNIELSQDKRQDIAIAMGVPHSMLMANAANYATAQQDEANFYNSTVIPSARVISSAINRQLFSRYNMRFVWFPEEMDIFQHDENQRAQSFATYVNAGVQPSIAAEMLGLELPEGVEYADLDPEPQPQTITVVEAEPPQPPQLEDMQRREGEAAQFRAWCENRVRRGQKVVPARFVAHVLTDAEKTAILRDVEDGAAEDAPFPVAVDYYP